MFFLKACPKCIGDLVVESDGRDRWGEPADFICIQCGYAARPAERESLIVKMQQALRQRHAVAARGARPPARVA